MLLAGKLAGAAVLSLLLWLSLDWGRAAAVLAHADPVLIWAALAASALNVLISAHKWQLLLRRARVSLAYGVAAQLYWIGAFFSNFLPTGVGGDAVRLMLTPAQGRLGTVAGTILVERLTGLLMLLQLSVLGLAFPLDLGDGSISPLLTAVATGSTGVVAMVLLAPGLFVASIERFVGMLPPSFRAPLGAAQRIAIQIMGPAGDRLAVAAAVLYSLPFYAAVILAQYFMLHAVGAHVSLFEVALGAPLVCAVTLLPVTVNGLFLAEGAIVLVYASVGVAPETALAAAILRRLVDLANSGFGGLLWLAWQTDPDEPQASPIEPERRVARALYALRGQAATLRYRVGGRSSRRRCPPSARSAPAARSLTQLGRRPSS